MGRAGSLRATARVSTPPQPHSRPYNDYERNGKFLAAKFLDEKQILLQGICYAFCRGSTGGVQFI